MRDARLMSWQHSQLYRLASCAEWYGRGFLYMQCVIAIAYLVQSIWFDVEPAWAVNLYGSDWYSGTRWELYLYIGLNAAWVGVAQTWRSVAYSRWERYEQLADYAERMAGIIAEQKAIREIT